MFSKRASRRSNLHFTSPAEWPCSTSEGPRVARAGAPCVSRRSTTDVFTHRNSRAVV